MLVELPPLPRGKTATRFFGQWGSPSKFKAILKDSYGTRDPAERGIGEKAGFFVFQCSSGTAMRTTDRPTDRPRAAARLYVSLLSGARPFFGLPALLGDIDAPWHFFKSSDWGQVQMRGIPWLPNQKAGRLNDLPRRFMNIFD